MEFSRVRIEFILEVFPELYDMMQSLENFFPVLYKILFLPG